MALTRFQSSLEFAMLSQKSLDTLLHKFYDIRELPDGTFQVSVSPQTRGVLTGRELIEELTELRLQERLAEEAWGRVDGPEVVY